MRDTYRDLHRVSSTLVGNPLLENSTANNMASVYPSLDLTAFSVENTILVDNMANMEAAVALAVSMDRTVHFVDDTVQKVVETTVSLSVSIDLSDSAVIPVNYLPFYFDNDDDEKLHVSSIDKMFRPVERATPLNDLMKTQVAVSWIDRTIFLLIETVNGWMKKIRVLTHSIDRFSIDCQIDCPIAE